MLLPGQFGLELQEGLLLCQLLLRLELIGWLRHVRPEIDDLLVQIELVLVLQERLLH